MSIFKKELAMRKFFHVNIHTPTHIIQTGRIILILGMIIRISTMLQNNSRVFKVKKTKQAGRKIWPKLLITPISLCRGHSRI